MKDKSNTFRMGLSQEKYLLLVLMLSSTFVASLNQTILAPALPSLMRDMNINAAQGQWFTTIFLLVNGVMIPITAYLTERFTVRKLFISSLAFFVVGTALAGFNATFSGFLIARVLQAIGFGVMMPVLVNVTMLMFPGDKRGEAMGYIGLVMTAAPALGPPLSGFVIDAWGWQMMFRILLPLMILNLVMAILFMKDNVNDNHPHLDVPSVVLSTLGFGLLLYSFSIVGGAGWLNPMTLGTFAFGVVLLVIFVRRQLGITSPILNMTVFRSKQFSVGTVLGMIVNASLIAGTIATPIYLQQVLGYSAFKATLVMLPSSLFGMIISPIVGRWFDRYGIVALARGGMLMMFIGTALFYTFDTESSFWYLSFCYFLRISGIYVAMMPLNTWSLNALSNRLLPHGNAMATTLRQVAGSIGTAALISIMTLVTIAERANGFVAATMAGFHAAFLASNVLIGIGVLITFFFVRNAPIDECIFDCEEDPVYLSRG